MSKQKLELTWIGKEKRPRLEPRILLEDPSKSYHAKARIGEEDSFDNRLIFGDNLLALKALEQEFTGKVKCVFIDPPYNTGSAFAQYDDGLEHSIWLGLMRDRLEILRRLLSDDGSLWITIDDNEAHYLKVLCDEVFGRANYIASAIWQKTMSVKNSTRHFSIDHDYVLVYARDAQQWEPNQVAASAKQRASYKNPDDDPRGAWQSISLSARNPYSKGLYAIRTPGGRLIDGPPAGSYWRVSEDKFWDLHKKGEIWWGKDQNGMPRRKMYLSEQGELTKAPQTIWFFDEVGHTQDAKKEALAFNSKDVFATPKPERLMARIVEIASNPGDLILDSFAGSGTTGAVAHKMARRWIMIELGEHCHTHIIPRLNKVIDGDDSGGVSESQEWEGGGGFRYYRLAPSLIVDDRWGNPVVNPAYNAAQLAEALCKLEGFEYAPSEEQWWAHGRSSERDFIFVTTQTLSADQLQSVSEEVGEDRSLMVCCAAFHGVNAARASERWPNITLKKIPKMVLSRCEWGHDDYSLNVANLPMAKPDAVKSVTGDMDTKPLRVGRVDPSQGGLFAGEEA
ncbi:MAG: site-specific DNA-methyltransferase [Ideonella sp.]|nr:site-specific DNA-methyltransferase [Ideonella sp.]